MRAILQRVKKASVYVDEKKISEIGPGLLVFLAVHENDGLNDLGYMENKISNLRIFSDQEGKMNLSLKDVQGELMMVSQFTLYGDGRKGRRPSFTESAGPDKGLEYFDALVDRLKENFTVKTGEFGADMQVQLVNDGPVTIQLDSSKIY